MLHHPSKQIMPLLARNILATISLLKKQNSINNTPHRRFFFVKTKQTSINNVRPAEQIENSTITENPTVENLILPVMPKAQNRHPTKSSSVLQVLEYKKVSSLTAKGRNIYYMDRYQQKTISKLKNLLHDPKIISRNFKS
jgi:hypothetical protein